MPTLSAIIGFIFLGVGIGVGMAATISNLRSAKGPKELAFVRFNCLAAWAVVSLMLAMMYYLPSPWRYLVLIPYFFHLPIATYRSATKRQLIRRLEEMESAHHH